MSRYPDAPEEGDVAALVNMLSAIGLATGETYRAGADAPEIDFQCPVCQGRNRHGDLTAHMQTATTKWYCSICRYGGNVTTLLKRLGYYRKRVSGEIKYFQRDPDRARAKSPSSGATKDITRQTRDVLRLLDRSERTSHIVRFLILNYGLSRATAYERLRAVRDGRGGNRQLKAVQRARLLEKVRPGDRQRQSLTGRQGRGASEAGSPPPPGVSHVQSSPSEAEGVVEGCPRHPGHVESTYVQTGSASEGELQTFDRRRTEEMTAPSVVLEGTTVHEIKQNEDYLARIRAVAREHGIASPKSISVRHTFDYKGIPPYDVPVFLWAPRVTPNYLRWRRTTEDGRLLDTVKDERHWAERHALIALSEYLEKTIEERAALLKAFLYSARKNGHLRQHVGGHPGAVFVPYGDWTDEALTAARARAEIGASENRGTGRHDRYPYEVSNVIQAAVRLRLGIVPAVPETYDNPRKRPNFDIAGCPGIVRVRGQSGTLVRAEQVEDNPHWTAVVCDVLEDGVLVLGAKALHNVRAENHRPLSLKREGSENQNYLIEPPYDLTAEEFFEAIRQAGES